MRKTLLILLGCLQAIAAPLHAVESTELTTPPSEETQDTAPQREEPTVQRPPKKARTQKTQSQSSSTPTPKQTKPAPPKRQAIPPTYYSKNSRDVDYWDTGKEANEALNVSMIAWGIAFVVGIAIAAGLSNGPMATKTPDLQTGTTTSTTP